MITSKNSSRFPVGCRSALLASACVLSLVILQLPAVRAADAATLRPLADEAPSLPLTATFEKATGDEAGHYVLMLKNTSMETLAVSATIHHSVASHGETRAEELPEHSIEADQTWTIPGLVAADKIVVTAKGYAPLELTAP